MFLQKVKMRMKMIIFANIGTAKNLFLFKKYINWPWEILWKTKTAFHDPFNCGDALLWWHDSQLASNKYSCKEIIGDLGTILTVTAQSLTSQSLSLPLEFLRALWHLYWNGKHKEADNYIPDIHHIISFYHQKCIK